MSSLDESLYSRQIAVYGTNAMKTLTKAKVIIYGFNGACLELCKNLVLAGVNRINLISDPIINLKDLATNYYASTDDLGKKTKELNG